MYGRGQHNNVTILQLKKKKKMYLYMIPILTCFFSLNLGSLLQ